MGGRNSERTLWGISGTCIKWIVKDFEEDVGAAIISNERNVDKDIRKIMVNFNLPKGDILDIFDSEDWDGALVENYNQESVNILKLDRHRISWEEL